MKELCLEAFPHSLSNSDLVSVRDHMLLLQFTGRRKVLSTSAWNGGIREDLQCAFNYDLSHGKTRWCTLLDSTLAGHMRRIAENADLPEANTGLCTAAQIKNTAIMQARWEETEVTAFVTAGIDENGGRAGDPATWQEKNGTLGIPVGTVNILLHFNCDLSDGALTGALLTATEAKVAAIQELLLPSKVSNQIATGSGTDGAVLICDPGSPCGFTDTGKHSKLGEMIGKTVLSAVKKALFLQTGASPARLHHAIRLLERFGLTEEYLQTSFPSETKSRLETLCRSEETWTLAAVWAHLLDLHSWGVIDSAQLELLAEKFLAVKNADALAAFTAFLQNRKLS